MTDALDPFALARRGEDAEPAGADQMPRPDCLVALGARRCALIEEAKAAREAVDNIEAEAIRILPFARVQTGVFVGDGGKREAVWAYSEAEIAAQLESERTLWVTLRGEGSEAVIAHDAKHLALAEDLRQQIADRNAKLAAMGLPDAERRADELDDAVGEVERQIASTTATSIEGLEAQFGILRYDLGPRGEALLETIQAGVRRIAKKP